MIIHQGLFYHFVDNDHHILRLFQVVFLFSSCMILVYSFWFMCCACFLSFLFVCSDIYDAKSVSDNLMINVL